MTGTFCICRLIKMNAYRYYSFTTYTKYFGKLRFLTPDTHTHTYVCLSGGFEVLVFRKILSTYKWMIPYFRDFSISISFRNTARKSFLWRQAVKAKQWASSNRYLCDRIHSCLAFPKLVLKKWYSKNFRKIHSKTLVSESLFNMVAGLHQRRCFPVNFSKFLRPLFLDSTSGRLFLAAIMCFVGNICRWPQITLKWLSLQLFSGEF